MGAVKLQEFTIVRSGESYVLRITAEGDRHEFLVDYERLDLIAEAIDTELDRESDSHDEVADGAE